MNADRHPVRLATLLAAGALTVGLAGCSAGSGDAARTSSGGGVAAEVAPDSTVADRTAVETGQKAAGRTASSQLSETSFLGRSVIATAQVTVRTTDVSRARDEVGDLLRRYVGYVAEESTVRDRDGDTVRSVLRLRIPTERFDRALGDLEQLAPGVDIDRSTEDVTQQVVDVASRIRTQEVSLGRLRRFLGRATSVEDIVRLETEIARREGDVGSLRAQQRELRDLTSESTITVRLQKVSKEQVEQDRDDAGFLAGLVRGWDAFTGSLLVVSTAVGVVLPFAVVLALLAGPVLVWLRRRRAVSTSSTTEAAA